MPEMIEPIGRDLVPFYNLSVNPKVWADDFVKLESAQYEFQRLRAESEKIRKAPRAKSDLKKIIKKAYSDHCENIAKELAGALSQHSNPFDRLPHLLNNPCNSYIPVEIIEKALDLMPEAEGAMTDEQRQKKLDSIQRKMDAQKEIVKKCSLQAYIQMKNGNVQCDSRAEFVRFWRDKQAWIARPCNIQGIDLGHCSEQEQWLYKKLKIANSILPKAVKLPYRP